MRQQPPINALHSMLRALLTALLARYKALQRGTLQPLQLAVIPTLRPLQGGAVSHLVLHATLHEIQYESS